MSRGEGKPMNIGAPPAPLAHDPSVGPIDQLSGMRGMTQTRTQYQTALTVHVARDLEKIRKSVITEATYARDGFFYAWTQKDKSKGEGGTSLIEGVSIDGAMILVRNWGNAVCDPDLTDETPTHWMLRATFIDLETGFTTARMFRQRKNQKLGKHDEERSLDIQFQIGQSKAIRNTVVRALPQWLVDEAMTAAKDAAAKRYTNVKESADRAVKAYASKNVTLEQLERKLGKKRADWIPADLVLLSAILKGINEGQSSVGQEFSNEEEAPDEPSSKDVAAAAEQQTAAGVAEGIVPGFDAGTAPLPKTEAVETKPTQDAKPEPEKPVEPRKAEPEPEPFQPPPAKKP